MVHLKYQKDNQEVRVGLEAFPFRVGRGKECELVLDDPSCSRVHFQIERSAAGYKLVDLESQRGTWVNGIHVNQHLLRSGDQIQAGDVRLSFEQELALEKKSSGASTRRRAAVKPACPPKYAEGERRREAGALSKSDSAVRTSGIHTRSIAGPVGRILLLLGSVAVIGSVVVLVWNPGETGVQDSVLLRKAEDLVYQRRYEEALEVLRSIPAESAFFDQAEKLRNDLDERWIPARAREERFERATRRWNEIYRMYREQPEQAERIRAECEQFLREYSDWPQAGEAKVLLARLGGAAAPDRASPDAELATLRSLVEDYRHRKNYGAALRSLDGFVLDHPPPSAAGESATRLLQQVLEEAQNLFEEAQLNVRDLEDRGKYREACEALEPIVQGYSGDVRLAGLWDRAKRDLERLRDFSRQSNPGTK